MQNFVTHNLFSAIHTQDKMILSQSCSCATWTVAKQVQGLFHSALSLVQLLLEGRLLKTRVVYDCREIVSSFYKLSILSQSVYTPHSSLQDASCWFWCCWMAGNKESYSYLCTHPPKVSRNVSVEGSPTNRDWDCVHLWKQDGELYNQCLGYSLNAVRQSSGVTWYHAKAVLIWSKNKRH